MATMRLDRFLSEMGAATRSQIREACKKKQVRVNGMLAPKSDQKIDPEKDVVEFRGEIIGYAPMEYYMLNKPQGVVTATEDHRQKTVLDLLDTRKRKDLFPVGRLDKDTEGLLLITNDGKLANALLSPKHHAEKLYFAKVQGRMPESAIELFAKGIDIGDEKMTLPAKLTLLSVGDTESEINLVLTEGRYHQVKRMCEAVGCPVTYLKRLNMGSLTLDPQLRPGEYRPLTEQEIMELKDYPATNNS